MEAETSVRFLFEESKEPIGSFVPRAFFGLGESLGEVQAPPKDQFVGPFDGIALGASEICSPQSDRVNSGDSVQACRDGEWSDILFDRGKSLHHDEIADANELVENRAAAEKSPVAQADMTGEKAIVGDDVPISEGSIVAKVDAGH